MKFHQMLLGSVLAAGVEARGQELRNGDLVFHSSLSRQSKAIRLVTRSPLTHVGLLWRDQGGWQVLEAEDSVQLTPYETFLGRGAGGRVLVKRWRAGLLPSQLGRMRQLGRSYLGLPYDPLFRWGDERIYCSELVWKIYARGAGLRLGQPQTFAQLDLSSAPAQVLVRERGLPPSQEPIVTPAALAACAGLVIVKNTMR